MQLLQARRQRFESVLTVPQDILLQPGVLEGALPEAQAPLHRQDARHAHSRRNCTQQSREGCYGCGHVISFEGVLTSVDGRKEYFEEELSLRCD